ncbi:TniQ family protein [Streptomyces goshikiensis]|uniref:TniQ family protein n=1 Tax=Streptomyces goshikiensis TaxID=1942 RepID=UPI00366277B0
MNRPQRPLPRSLAPLPEESLPGFLLRLAHRLDRAPSRVADLCGLSPYQHRLPAQYLMALPSGAASAFAAATRLTVSEARELTLTGSGLAAAYPPMSALRLHRGRTHASARLSWALNLSGRFCPECLAGNGSVIQNANGGPWRLGWHLPVVFACAQHQRVLSYFCPACNRPPNQRVGTERTGLLVQRSIPGLHPTQCRQPAETGRRNSADHCCGARLDRAPAPAAIPGLDLLTNLQSRIDQALLPLVAVREDHGLHFPDLIAAAQLIKFSWPQGAWLLPIPGMARALAAYADSLGPALADGRSPSSAWDAPDDPLICGTLLLAAAALLDTVEKDGLRATVQPLARTAFERLPANAAAALRRSEYSTRFARALAPRTRGFYRAGGHRAPRLRASARLCRFAAAHVPALLPEAWFDAHFGILVQHLAVPLTTWNTRHLRRAASLRLVEMAAGGTWPESALALAIPRASAEQSLRVLGRLLADGLWTHFDSAVEGVAREMDAAARLVDFAARRERLWSWRLSEHDWSQLLTGLDRFTGRGTSPTAEAATALVWAQATEGDHLHSPVLTTLRTSGQCTSRITATISQLSTLANRRGDKLKLLLRLERYANTLANRCDHDAAPILASRFHEAGCPAGGQESRRCL